MTSLEELKQTPIPGVPSPSGWRKKRILDSNEPLVMLKNSLYKSVFYRAQYKQRGIESALDCCYLRKSVLEMIVLVAEFLEQYGLALVIWDGWRPMSVQQEIYDRFRQEIKQNNPTASNTELDALAQVYVSQPSSDLYSPSPHITGGAVDLTLANYDGQELRLGTDFDDFSKFASTRYYEDFHAIKELTKEEHEFLENRRILYHAMISYGFTNYCEEWWHFDYGNQFWATVSGKDNAIYGLANPA